MKDEAQDSQSNSPLRNLLHTQQSSCPFFRLHLEATGEFTLSSPGRTEPEVRNSGKRNLPCKPVALLMQHHTTTETEARVRGRKVGKWGRGGRTSRTFLRLRRHCFPH